MSKRYAVGLALYSVLQTLILFPMDSKALQRANLVSPQDPIAHSVVLIENDYEDGDYCTGALVAPRFVLTAAHCTSEDPDDLKQVHVIFSPEPESLALQLWDYRVGKSPNPPVSNLLRSVKVVHYPPKTKDEFDIALLELTDDAPEGYVSLQIAKHFELPLWVAGFGGIDLNNYQESLILRSGQLAFKDWKAYPTKATTYQHQGTAFCPRDSGGPVYFVSPSGLQIVGVVHGAAWRNSSDDPTCGLYGLFTKVTPWISWIQRTVNSP